MHFITSNSYIVILHVKYFQITLKMTYLNTFTFLRNQVFKKISFSPKVKEIAKSLDLKDPAIVQGMYIFKQPGIGLVIACKFVNTHIHSVSQWGRIVFLNRLLETLQVHLTLRNRWHIVKPILIPNRFTPIT